MSHEVLPAHAVPRVLGYVMGLVTAADFISSLSVLMASAELRGGLNASPTDFIWILTAYAAAGMLIVPLIHLGKPPALPGDSPRFDLCCGREGF